MVVISAHFPDSATGNESDLHALVFLINLPLLLISLTMGLGSVLLLFGIYCPLFSSELTNLKFILKAIASSPKICFIKSATH